MKNVYWRIWPKQLDRKQSMHFIEVKVSDEESRNGWFF